MFVKFQIHARLQQIHKLLEIITSNKNIYSNYKIFGFNHSNTIFFKAIKYKSSNTDQDFKIIEHIVNPKLNFRQKVLITDI